MSLSDIKRGQPCQTLTWNPQQVLVPTQGWTHSVSRRQEIIIREAIWVIRRVALVSLNSIFPRWDLIQTLASLIECERLVIIEREHYTPGVLAQLSD